MGKVQSSYIHPDINQSAQHLFAIARRPYGRYNFGPLRRSTHFSILAKARAEDKAEASDEIVSEGSSLCPVSHAMVDGANPAHEKENASAQNLASLCRP